MAFDRTEYGKLLAIMQRLAEPKALTPNERRDLAVAMHTVLRSAACLDRPGWPEQPDALHRVVSRIFRTFDQATASVCMSCG